MTSREPIDSWNPFDLRPRKSVLQALYIGLTGAMFFWTAWLGLFVLLANNAESAELSGPEFCLAINLYHEGLKEEPIEGLFAIAQVQLTRAGRKVENICKVTQKRGQFTWTSAPPGVENSIPWRNAQSVARLTLRIHAVHQKDWLIDNADHYHALYVSPYWKPHMDPKGVMGNHLFYKDPTGRMVMK